MKLHGEHKLGKIVYFECIKDKWSLLCACLSLTSRVIVSGSKQMLKSKQRTMLVVYLSLGSLYLWIRKLELKCQVRSSHLVGARWWCTSSRKKSARFWNSTSIKRWIKNGHQCVFAFLCFYSIYEVNWIIVFYHNCTIPLYYEENM